MLKKMLARWWHLDPRKVGITTPKPPPPPPSATWDGKDFSVIQMLPAKRENGVPACWVDADWTLRVRGYNGPVPIGSLITSVDDELIVTEPLAMWEAELLAETTGNCPICATDDWDFLVNNVAQCVNGHRWQVPDDDDSKTFTEDDRGNWHEV